MKEAWKVENAKRTKAIVRYLKRLIEFDKANDKAMRNPNYHGPVFGQTTQGLS
jgi:hypothetical protein